MAFPLASGAPIASPLAPPSPTPGGNLTLITKPTKTPTLTDQQLKDLWESDKKECFADRWIWERQWQRGGYYVSGWQWLAPYSMSRGWRKADVGANVPTPVSQYPKIAVQSIRAMLTSIKSGVNVRPTSKEPKAVITAATAQDYDPVLRDLHRLSDVLTEFDWNFLVYGNSWLHSYWDPLGGDAIDVPWEACAGCGLELRSDAIAEAGQQCPSCHGTQFAPAVDPESGEPRVDRETEGAGVTCALSPLEIAFPLQYQRWRDVPKLVRLRWRDKSYAVDHPVLKDQMQHFNYQKGATERSLQIVQSLPYQNDLGPSGARASGAAAGSSEAEGYPEYEVWYRPCPAYPEGLVFRVAGDSNPIILHLEESEGLPGPLPYHDVKGRSIFTFSHAAFEHVGGRVLGSGVLDPAIPKIDELNRHDSLVEMIMMGMASPLWVVAKGSEPQFLQRSGRPMIINWDPLVANGKGEPKRIKGAEPGRAFQSLRQEKVRDIEEALGLGALLKGVPPAGVEAYSALQLLDEISKSRFANAFQARAQVIVDWFGWALELERQYGPKTRAHALMVPNRGWATKIFQTADLSLLGDIKIIAEASTTMPTTTLGKRAAVEHGNQLRLFDPSYQMDPNVKHAMLELLGITELEPGLNAHVEACLRIQEDFMVWLESGGPAKLRTVPDPVTGQPTPDIQDPSYPLQWRRWYKPEIHRERCLLWANSDRMVDLFKKFPPATGLVDAYLQEIDLALLMQQQGDRDPNPSPDVPPPPPPGAAPSPNPAPRGAGRALANSQQNSAPVGNTPQPAMPALNAQPPAANPPMRVQ